MQVPSMKESNMTGPGVPQEPKDTQKFRQYLIFNLCFQIEDMRTKRRSCTLFARFLVTLNVPQALGLPLLIISASRATTFPEQIIQACNCTYCKVFFIFLSLKFLGGVDCCYRVTNRCIRSNSYLFSTTHDNSFPSLLFSVMIKTK